MASRWIYLTFFVLVGISECFAGHRHGKKGKGDDDDDEDSGWDWSAAAGLGVIIGICVVGAALFSLAAWLTCTIYSKCRKDRVGVIKVGSRGSAPPAWSCHLIFKPELAAGFGDVSEGFLRLGAAHLVRNRAGTSYTDGARWAVGMAKGKHVFEITWPWGHRGFHAGVGVATEDAPIKCKGTMPLVGSNPKTWGLDIVKRRALHKNKGIMSCPTDGSYVPDKFLMYVDMDEGTVGYGNDVTYWGEVIAGLPKQTLYLMVGASKWQSELSVIYKGSAPDGDYGNLSGGKPPHHLPPIYFGTPQAPPTYKEFDEKKGEPLMVQPAAPSEELMYEPPPPYSRPPSGYKPEKA